MTPTAPSASPTAASAANQETRPRILVTDDSRVIRQAIKKILSTDFEVIQAEDGAVAWEQLEQGADVQAIITDIEMPKVDGYELICRVRGSENTRLRDLPIIVITGTDDESIRQRAFACGATDFIIKPIDSIQLQARVQAYAHYDQTTRELTERAVELEEQSISDPVTGLRSRRYFIERGDQDLAFALRRSKDLTVIRVDIDGFKKIYRAHGDEAADRLLVWLAKLLVANARVEDTVARIAGAEFAILANASTIDSAFAVCERVRNAVAENPFLSGQTAVAITLSMGVASIGQDRLDSIDALIKLAQQRLYHAQSEGGNRVCTSVLGHDAQAIEEVFVAPIENVPPVEEAVAVGSIEALPIADLEDLIRREVGAPEDSPKAARSPSPPKPTPEATKPAKPELKPDVAVSPSSLTPELLSVDRALHLIADGQGHVLRPYLEQLLHRLAPLVALCNNARTKNK